MFGRGIRSLSSLVCRLLQSSDTFRSRAEWSPFVLKGAWCYRGNPGLSLLSCVSLQIEFICVHWNFVRKHLASQLCRRLLRSCVTPLKQPMASSSVRPTYSMRCQRRVFTQKNMNVCWRLPLAERQLSRRLPRSLPASQWPAAHCPHAHMPLDRFDISILC